MGDVYSLNTRHVLIYQTESVVIGVVGTEEEIGNVDLLKNWTLFCGSYWLQHVYLYGKHSNISIFFLKCLETNNCRLLAACNTLVIFSMVQFVTCSVIFFSL